MPRWVRMLHSRSFTPSGALQTAEPIGEVGA